MNLYKVLSFVILLLAGLNIHMIITNNDVFTIQSFFGLIYSVLLLALSRVVWKIGSESK